MRLKTLFEGSSYAKETEKDHDISVIVFSKNTDKEYSVESWNPSTYEKNQRRNIYYTDCKDDALTTAKFILKRGI